MGFGRFLLNGLWLVLVACHPVWAEWGKFPITSFSKPIGSVSVVDLDDGPAILVQERGTTAHLLRRRNGNWTEDSFEVPGTGAIFFGGAFDRGDGKKRLYFASMLMPLVWEVSPYGIKWQVSEFCPLPDHPVAGRLNLGGMASIVSTIDGRPRLYIHRGVREDILECLWDESGWKCEKALEKAGSAMEPLLYSAPDSWGTGNILIRERLIAARRDGHWKIVNRPRGFYGLEVSKEKPRTIYTFDHTIVEVQYSKDFKTYSQKTILTPKHRYYGQTIATIPGDGREKIYGVGWDGNIHSLGLDDGKWRQRVVAKFPGKAYGIAAGDARGDGNNRIYVVESEQPQSRLVPDGSVILGRASVARTRLWELARYRKTTVFDIPDPKVPDGEDAQTIGDILRTTIARYAHFGVVSDRSMSAATNEERLFDLLCQGKECERVALKKRKPDFDLLVEIHQVEKGIKLSATIRDARSRKLHSKFSRMAGNGANLFEEIQDLGANIAEDWPLK